MDSQRRQFIQQLCYTCGAISFLPACSRNYSTWRFFSDDEARMIISISEQFIPADNDPGASDARVVNFFDKQLTGHYKRHQETYRTGLARIDASALQLYDKKFSDLEWEQQTQFLESMEHGELPADQWAEADQRSFFNLILDHTMQGFYGSPRHGGNCNYVSFKMLKIDYPHVIGQNRYPTEETQPNPASS